METPRAFSDFNLCHCCGRNPQHGIVPAYIFEAIVQNTQDEKRRRVAVKTLEFDQSFRAFRQGRVAEPFYARRRKRFRRGVGQPRRGAEPLTAERTIYDAMNTYRLPGRLARREGGLATGDPAVDEAYDGLGATLELYLDIYGRDSLDDEGMPLKASVHYAQDYENAFWDGQYMVFGDGDGDQFNRFTVAVDIIGHELTHGVTDYESGLRYWGQSGALNEHLSDVFGSLVKQYSLNQTAGEADWLIGAGLFTDQVKGVAIRSMKEPGTAYDDPELGKDPQPGHMRDYVDTLRDYGGVHINSGILNRAFYLAAAEIGGYAWETAGYIWYVAMTSPFMTQRESFASFAQKTVRVARRLYGVGSPVARAVRHGWAEVGIIV